MLTECPGCHKVISTEKFGMMNCPKCGALIFVGDPMKNEENSLVDTRNSAEEQEKNKNQENDAYDRVNGKMQDLLKRLTKVLPAGTPWDSVREIGFSEAFFRTTKELLAAPEQFFKAMICAFRPSFLPFYGIITAFVGALLQTFWTLKFFQSAFPDFASFKEGIASLGAFAQPLLENEENLQAVFSMMNPTGSFLTAQLLLSPLVSIVFTAFILHTGSLLLGANTRLIHFYRMSSFIMVTSLFNIIPLFGNMISFVWRAVLVYKGGKVVNGFSGGKAKGFAAFYIVMQLLFTGLGIL